MNDAVLVTTSLCTEKFVEHFRQQNSDALTSAINYLAVLAVDGHDKNFGRVQGNNKLQPELRKKAQELSIISPMSDDWSVGKETKGALLQILSKNDLYKIGLERASRPRQMHHVPKREDLIEAIKPRQQIHSFTPHPTPAPSSDSPPGNEGPTGRKGHSR